MKKNSLTAAVVAGVAGVAGLASVANAVNINPDGLGQVLIYPYYTVNGGNNTLLSVVNTTDEVKAVKVRFLESLNSREVLDFNLYLSPFDVWTAAVVSSTEDGSGAAQLVTADRSCTVPDVFALQPVAFRNYQYAGVLYGDTNVLSNDDATNSLTRTREGYVEIIEMGVVDETVSATATGFEAAAIHQANGIPLNCARLDASWNGGTWAGDPSVDFRGPTGGLFGTGIIVDAENGTALSYNADAVDGFYTIGDAALHTGPGSTQPSLAQAQTGLGEADAIIFDNGALITLDFTSGLNAVSSVFMHDAIFNEYSSAEGLDAASEWVITFPTKRLHIEQATAAARLPFANDSNGSGDALQFDASGYCEPIEIDFYDREERTPGTLTSDNDFSPPPPIFTPAGLNLCWEANVITFNQFDAVSAGASEVLGSTNAFNIDLEDPTGTVSFQEGWIAMGIGNANNYLLDDGAGIDADANGAVEQNQVFGLPLTGFWVANFVNGNAAPGMLANYSVISKHRASRSARTVEVIGGVITPTGFAAS